jgi:hypothetical protein
MSPWASPFKVWQDIMEAREPGFNKARGYDYEAFEGNASTRWGLAFEDAIVKLAEEKQGREIGSREDAFMYYMDAKNQAPVHMAEGMGFKDEYKYPHITCHVDGLYTVNDENNPMIFNGPRIHEGKTTTAYGFSDKWGEPGSDRIPIEYQIQVQHQMLCTGADEAIVSVLVFPKRPDEWEAEGYQIKGETDDYEIFKDDKFLSAPIEWAEILTEMGFFHQYTVKADPALHAKMLEKYEAWWAKHVLGGKLPDPVDYADIRAMITAPTGTILIDDDTARWFKEYKDIGSEIGATGNLAKRRDQLKTLILKRAKAVESTLDDESTDKWIFRDGQGNKLGSYGKNAKGSMIFR